MSAIDIKRSYTIYRQLDMLIIGVKSTGHVQHVTYFHVYYSFVHQYFWQNTKRGWNFFLLIMGGTLVSLAHLQQTWVLVEGHIGAVLKQLEANAVSNIATHHLNLLKVSLYSQSVGQQKKCIQPMK